MSRPLYTYVRFVDEADLPPGHDWLVALCDRDRTCDHLAVFIDRTKVTPRNLEDAWDAVREVAQGAGLNAPTLPRQQVSGLPYIPGQRAGALRVV